MLRLGRLPEQPTNSVCVSIEREGQPTTAPIDKDGRQKRIVGEKEGNYRKQPVVYIALLRRA